MNSKQRELYEAANRRRMIKFEREYLPELTKIMHREMKRAAKQVRAGRRPTFGEIEGLAPYLQRLYTKVGVFYTRKTIREIKAQEEKAFGIDAEWIARIIEYFGTNLLNKAVLPISETNRQDILKVLTYGTEQGWSFDRMAFELERPDLSLWKARQIVRTELLKAQNAGKDVGAEESEFETVKQWIAAKDERTRRSHREVDGKYVEAVSGKFAVRKKKGGFDMMSGPGDAEASAENVINCRCTSAVVAKRDENGRLIRKRKISVLLPSDINRNRQVVTI